MNFIENGAVLPGGLLSVEKAASLNAFARNFQNNTMRVGVVVASYAVSDDKNNSKLAMEYDVVTLEQNEDRGGTSILYRNCLSMEGLGSIADYFEKSLRPRTKKDNAGPATNLAGQDGNIVLLLCLDGNASKGIVLGSLGHPDRKTGIKDSEPFLQGEYNGVNVVINSDGSSSLTWKGATKSDGTAADKTQGNTEIDIEKDGSFQLKHSTITQRFDRNGKSTLTTTDDVTTTTQKSFNVTATENVVITSTKDTTLSMDKFILNAQGSAALACDSLSIAATSDISVKGSKIQLEAESMVGIKASNITLDGNVALGGAGGQPLLMLNAQMLGVGNLGIPVLSSAIIGFTTKVTGQ